MAKKEKMKTPDWILEGFDSEADYNKSKGIGEKKKGHHGRTPNQVGLKEDFTKKSLLREKIFNIRECPKCGSDDVAVVIGEIGMWECKKCKWKGRDIIEKELTEDEFMKYLDKRGEEVA